MKRSDYKEILGVIRSHPWDFDSCLDVLRKKFPEVSVETLRSILSHQHKERVKSTIYYQVKSYLLDAMITSKESISFVT